MASPLFVLTPTRKCVLRRFDPLVCTVSVVASVSEMTDFMIMVSLGFINTVMIRVVLINDMLESNVMLVILRRCLFISVVPFRLLVIWFVISITNSGTIIKNGVSRISRMAVRRRELKFIRLVMDIAGTLTELQGAGMLPVSR